MTASIATVGTRDDAQREQCQDYEQDQRRPTGDEDPHPTPDRAGEVTTAPLVQQLGAVVVAGLLLDAFVVRPLLVPAMVQLLGRWSVIRVAPA